MRKGRSKSSPELPDFLFPRGELFPTRPALSQFIEGKWKTLTYKEVEKRVEAFAAKLILGGLQLGDRVAILAEPSPQWLISFFGILKAGGIAVPFDIKWTPTELNSGISDCTPRFLLSSLTQREVANRVRGKAEVLDVASADELVRTPFPKLNVKDTAVLIYTSGTTGRPKGVMITFESLLFQTNELLHGMEVTEEDVFLSMIPLNHLFELTCGILSPIRAGAEICFFSSLYPEEIFKAVRERNVTRMTTVPLFLRMVKNAIERQVLKAKPLERFVFRNSLKIARRIRYQPLKRIMLHRIAKIFGKNFKEFFCGGAPLETPIIELSRAVGIPILQGYGMTEAGPVIATNFRKQKRMRGNVFATRAS